MQFTDHIPAPCREPVSVVHADADILVIAKPSGLLSVPGRYLKDSVLHRILFDFADANVVHRLDLDTSGVMVFARSKSAARSLSQQFRDRLVEKEYRAVVWGELAPGRHRLEFPMSPDPERRPRHRVDAAGKPAITEVEVVSVSAGQTTVKLFPKTGRSHQLRVHLAHIGHPILGCDLYAHEAAFTAADRLMLHACRLGFEHPLTRERVQFEVEPPFGT